MNRSGQSESPSNSNKPNLKRKTPKTKASPQSLPRQTITAPADSSDGHPSTPKTLALSAPNISQSSTLASDLEHNKHTYQTNAAVADSSDNQPSSSQPPAFSEKIALQRTYDELACYQSATNKPQPNIYNPSYGYGYHPYYNETNGGYGNPFPTTNSTTQSQTEHQALYSAKYPPNNNQSDENHHVSTILNSSSKSTNSAANQPLQYSYPTQYDNSGFAPGNSEPPRECDASSEIQADQQQQHHYAMQRCHEYVNSTAQYIEGESRFDRRSVQNPERMVYPPESGLSPSQSMQLYPPAVWNPPNNPAERSDHIRVESEYSTTPTKQGDYPQYTGLRMSSAPIENGYNELSTKSTSQPSKSQRSSTKEIRENNRKATASSDYSCENSKVNMSQSKNDKLQARPLTEKNSENNQRMTASSDQLSKKSKANILQNINVEPQARPFTEEICENNQGERTSSDYLSKSSKVKKLQNRNVEPPVSSVSAKGDPSTVDDAKSFYCSTCTRGFKTSCRLKRHFATAMHKKLSDQANKEREESTSQTEQPVPSLDSSREPGNSSQYNALETQSPVSHQFSSNQEIPLNNNKPLMVCPPVPRNGVPDLPAPPTAMKLLSSSSVETLRQEVQYNALETQTPVSHQFTSNKEIPPNNNKPLMVCSPVPRNGVPDPDPSMTATEIFLSGSMESLRQEVQTERIPLPNNNNLLMICPTYTMNRVTDLPHPSRALQFSSNSNMETLQQEMQTACMPPITGIPSPLRSQPILSTTEQYQASNHSNIHRIPSFDSILQNGKPVYYHMFGNQSTVGSVANGMASGYPYYFPHAYNETTFQATAMMSSMASQSSGVPRNSEGSEFHQDIPRTSESTGEHFFDF